MPYTQIVFIRWRLPQADCQRRAGDEDDCDRREAAREAARQISHAPDE
jgi:hypothetical protein